MSERQPYQIIQVLVKRGVLYLSLLIALLLLVFCLNRYLFSQYKYALPPDTETLITGSSLVGCGVNPETIGNAVNISQGGELYPMSLIKLRSILEQDHDLRSVIVAFSPGMFTVKMEEVLIGHHLFQKNVIRRLHPISSPYDYEGWGISDKTLWQNFFQYYALPNWAYTKMLWQNPNKQRKGKKSSFPYIGKFRQVDTTVLNLTKTKVIDQLTVRTEAQGRFSDTQKQAIQDIVALCKEKELDLILAGVPVYQQVYNLCPEHVIQSYLELSEELDRHDHVHIFDLSTHFLPDSMYYDASHLNLKGSKFMTDSLVKWLHKQDFYLKHPVD